MKKLYLVFFIFLIMTSFVKSQEVKIMKNTNLDKPEVRVINHFWSNPFFYEFQNNMYGTSLNGSVVAGVKYKSFTFSGEIFEKYYSINSFNESENLKGSWNFLGGTFDFFYEPIDWFEFKVGIGAAWFSSAYQTNNGTIGLTQGSITFMFDAFFRPHKYIRIQSFNNLNLVLSNNSAVPYYSGEIRCEFNPYIRWMNIYFGIGASTWIIEEPVNITTGMLMWTVGLSFDLTPSNFTKRNKTHKKINYVQKADKEINTTKKQLKDSDKIEKLKKAKKGDVISFTSIIFYPDSSRIKSESIPILNAISKVLLDDRLINIEIRGHTNDVGNPKAELKLSKERAEAVKNYIVQKGVGSSRIKIYGYGSMYTKSGSVEESNRRVEIKISDREIF